MPGLGVLHADNVSRCSGASHVWLAACQLDPDLLSSVGREPSRLELAVQVPGPTGTSQQAGGPAGSLPPLAKLPCLLYLHLPCLLLLIAPHL